MGIKKIIAICIIMVTINMTSLMSASQGSDAISIGMSEEELFKIYHTGHIKKFEKSDNEEVFVFDDISTSIPDDTITFYLVDGKVKAWDKNRVIFATDEGSRAAIQMDISKEDLLRIYSIGNLKAYTRTGNKEVGTFYDILSSDPDDTITFYLVDGKVKSWDSSTMILPTSEELHKIFPTEKRKAYVKSGNAEAETYYNSLTSDPNDTITFYLYDGRVNSWEMNAEASIANVKMMDEMMSAAKAKVQSEDDKAKAEADRAKVEAVARAKAEVEADRTKAQADFKEIISAAKADLDARARAMEERNRYNNSQKNYSTDKDDFMKAKQAARLSSIHSRGWYYNGGLYYR